MPEYLAPGVYVEEVERGPKPIEGVSTSTAGFLGETERGPTDPQLVTSYPEFERVFGGVTEGSNLAYAVDGFFRNGGSRCYVGRVTAAENAAAAGLLADVTEGLQTDTRVLDFGVVQQGDTATESVYVRNASGVDDLRVAAGAPSASGANGGDFSPSLASGSDVTLGPGEDAEVEVEFTPSSSGRETATLEVPFEERDGQGSWRSAGTLAVELRGGSPLVAAVGPAGQPGSAALSATVAALDFGELDSSSKTTTFEVTNVGNVDLRLVDGSLSVVGERAGDFTPATTASGDVTLTPGDSAVIEVEFAPSTDDRERALLEIPYQVDDQGSWEDAETLTVELEGGQALADAEAVGPGDWGEHVALLVEDATMYEPGQNELFRLVVRYWADGDDLATARQYDADTELDVVPDPDAEEVYDNLSPRPSSSNYYETRVNGASNLITLDQNDGGRPRPSRGTPTWLSWTAPQSPAQVGKDHFVGDSSAPPEERTGLAGFEKIDGISIVCVPDEHSHSGLTAEVESHCRELGDRFAVLQSPPGATDPGSVTRPVDSTYAAFYYPWLEVLHPETNVPTDVPPGGHVAGIYAGTDADRGVHKAPANVVVRGVQGLQVDITKGDQETLNPKGVNCIRSFRGRGIRVWGARTTSSDPSWKYVNVRRLFLYLEESIDEGTQWVVFEPNDEKTWARVRQTVSNFLTGVWEDGALMGSTPEEAFYVKCDRTTMTQDDIDNGRLICEIGVAPVKPAEFVVFRISQWTSGAE